MERKRPVIAEDQMLRSIQQATYYSKIHFDEMMVKAENAKADKLKTQRLKAGECAFCFYFRDSRFGGAAITTSNCRGCGEQMTFSNTNTDDFCKKCSEKYELCVRCGGDLNLRAKRRTLVYDKPE